MKQQAKNTVKARTVRYAFLQSVPVMCGYLVLGLAFGILLQKAGYNWLWALGISLFVYAGAMQFVLVSFLSAGTGLPTVAAMTLLLNSRHMFYGLSFIETFRRMGKLRPYMIFSLTDETYSLLCSQKYPEDVDGDRAAFLIALFDQGYWVVGSVAGGLLGQGLPFDVTGIDFAMTALFVVIFVEQWMESRSKLPAVTGLVSSTAFLLLLGPDAFILPALIVTVTILMLCRRMINRKNAVSDARDDPKGDPC